MLVMLYLFMYSFIHSFVIHIFGSILAEEFLTSHEIYEQEAKKHTEETAGQSLDDMEKVSEW